MSISTPSIHPVLQSAIKMIELIKCANIFVIILSH